MKTVQQWFKGNCNYSEGVAIYKASPYAKPDVIKRLKPTKNNYRQSLLIKSLRAILKDYSKPQETNPLPKPKAKLKHATDATIALENTQEQLKEESSTQHFRTIKYALLPAELKLRYREASTLFYQMMDLKFALNACKPKEDKKALALIIQIHTADKARLAIWNELNHWQQHKTLLPTKPDEYNNLNSDQLRTKKAQATSIITRQKKRIDAWYTDLETQKVANQIRLIENKIRKGESNVHQQELNINRINQILQCQ